MSILASLEARCCLALLALLPSVPGAQMPLTGPLSDATTGPLLSGVVYHAVGAISVPAGATLTAQPGAIVKLAVPNRFQVNGTLRASGTAPAPVIFTTLADDSAGGDTDGGGPSVGSPGAWEGLVFGPTADASALAHVEVRFAGCNLLAGISLDAADVTITDTTVRDGLADGMDLMTSASRPTVTGCSFLRNGDVAVDRMRIDAVPGFANNHASDNGGNYMCLTETSPTADLTIAPASCLEGALVFHDGSARVPAGVTLTLQAGVVVKVILANRYSVDGTLILAGTAAEPVVFTVFADDDHAGDTNNDGPSSGTPGYWEGLVLMDGADASVLEHAVVRFAGLNFLAGINLLSADATILDTTVRDGLAEGLDLFTSASRPTVTGCTFLDNGSIAVEGVPIDAVPGFADNHASGNGGDFLRVTETTPLSDVAIGPRACLEGALVFHDSSGSVPDGVTLTLHAGVVVKLSLANRYNVSGSLNLLGTAAAPIVFTALADDEHAGDTNGDGPSVGVPGAWEGLVVLPGAASSTWENVLVRYTGTNHLAGITNGSPSLAVRSVRVEHGLGNGFTVAALAGDAPNWVAFDCAQHGIELTGDDFALLHATSAGNGQAGIRRSGGYAGWVFNSIAWGNGGGNFDGFKPGEVFYSDGSPFAGSNGNLYADPLFADPTPGGGALGLQAASPCLDTAQLATGLAVVKDHDEASRVLNPMLGGALLPDMGAYERGVWTMATVGAPHVGSALTFAVSGLPGLSVYALGFFQGGAAPWIPYGMVLVGLQNPLVLGFRVVGFPLVLSIPDAPTLLGGSFGVQTVTLPLFSTGVGNLTNLYRARID